MKKIITLLLFCGAYCSLMAQSEAETKAQINKIKRSQSYLSAEATMPTEEEAIQQAKELQPAGYGPDRPDLRQRH